MRLTLLPFLLFLVVCSLGPVHGQASNKRQACEGVVVLDGDGMLLLAETDKNASLWCDAYIGDDKDSSLARQVLATCPTGSRCAIDGLFSGRGVFYWTKIVSVKRKQ